MGLDDATLSLLISGLDRDLDEGTCKDSEHAVDLLTALAAESWSRYEQTLVEAERAKRPRRVVFRARLIFKGVDLFEMDSHGLHRLVVAHIRDRLHTSAQNGNYASSDDEERCVVLEGVVEFNPALLDSPFSSDELVHRALPEARHVAICGADVPNQCTSQVAEHVTCPTCLNLQTQAP